MMVLFLTIMNSFSRQLHTDTWCSSGGLDVNGNLVSTGGFQGGANTVRYLGTCKGCTWREYPTALADRRWYHFMFDHFVFIYFFIRNFLRFVFLVMQGIRHKQHWQTVDLSWLVAVMPSATSTFRRKESPMLNLSCSSSSAKPPTQRRTICTHLSSSPLMAMSSSSPTVAPFCSVPSLTRSSASSLSSPVGTATTQPLEWPLSSH